MIVEGTVIKEQFVNKGGRPIDGAFDYFLKYNNEKRFIKFMESKVSSVELEDNLNKKVSYQISEHNGLWDTDDPNVQSRIGDYVVIWSIQD